MQPLHHLQKDQTLISADTTPLLNVTYDDALLDEKRRATRIEINQPLRYRVVDSHNNKSWEEGTALDISQKGVRLVGPAKLQTGTEIELYLRLSADSRTIRLQGKVVWLDHSTNGKTLAHHGITFKESKPYPGKERMIHFLADQLCRLVSNGMQPFSVRPAETLEDLKAAYAVVYKEFLPRGYCMENPSGMYYNFFCALPESRTFLLEKKGRLIGTISLILDSPCGLPMESLYPNEIAKLRNEGRHLAEVGLLALCGKEFTKGVFSLAHLKKLLACFQLIKIMFDYARSAAGVTDFVIGVHPKHIELYHYLKYDEIGPIRSYQGACGNPAVLMQLDVERKQKTLTTDRGIGHFFLGTSTPKGILEKHYRWNTNAVRELFIEGQPIWPKIPPEAQTYLKNCYPGL